MTAAFVAMLLLSLIVPMLLIVGWHLDSTRRDRMIADMRADYARDRGTWDRERQLLLNRIKPETAQYVETGVAQPDLPQAPMFDHDAGYWNATESTEEMADRMLREELEAARAAAVDNVAVG